jgi:hypothetical protein
MSNKSGLADSPFFAPPTVVTKEKVEEANTRTPVRTPERPNTRTRERVNARTGERKIIRHSFNIYEDQLEALRRSIARKTLQGQNINLSNLVREAIDNFLNR